MLFIRERSGAAVYRSGWPGKFVPREVRDKNFRPARFPCRGFDTNEVRQYLGLVADDIAWLHRELAASQDEAHRAKKALRDWQTTYASSVEVNT